MEEKDFNKNVLIASIVSAILITIWISVFGNKNITQKPKEEIKQEQTQKDSVKIKEYKIKKPVEQKEEAISREKALKKTKRERITIENDKIKGTISLKGLRFDDLILKKYKTEQNSKESITLLSPINTKESYFVDFGWLSADENLNLPTTNTIWKADQKNLTPETPITFTWKNKQGIKFITKISLDENYMFNIKQSVLNNSSKSITLISYGRINKQMKTIPRTIRVLHQGAIGSFNKEIKEISYKKLKKQNYNFKKDFDWIGLTDKYWLASIIPTQTNNIKTVDFKYKNNNYKTEFKTKEINVHGKENLNIEYNFFAGAKELRILDNYMKKLKIPLFDRTVDFGWFYFLTKPIYLLLKLFYELIGNFGISILLLTILVKGAMYPVARKSFISMAKMKKLQPKINSLKKQYQNDKIALNKKTMELYKKEKVNPMSGCLPTLIQIPVFFSLYKVLYVTIDMRHTPFFGYIKDLSASDPTTIWNLFGLLPYEANFVHIGLLPCLMSLTMFIQQKLNSATTDANTKAMTKYLPIMFLFVFANFPSGLLLYWIFSNTLTILQQYWIGKSLNK